MIRRSKPTSDRGVRRIVIENHSKHPGKVFIVYEPYSESPTIQPYTQNLIEDALGGGPYSTRLFDPKIDAPSIVEDARQVF